MNKIYHSCMYNNKDGSNKLYKNSENCCSGTNCPFWRQPWEIKSSVKTRLQEKKTRASYLRRINRYFQNFAEEKMDQQGKVVQPNLDNHNKDVCKIMNYVVDREHAKLLLLRQEIQIENTCNYLSCAKNVKNF